jgi:hypothetical protein
MKGFHQWVIPALPAVALVCWPFACLEASTAPAAVPGNDSVGQLGVTSASILYQESIATSLAATGQTLSLYDGTTLFTGVSFTQLSLSLPGAGDLSVTLQDLEFPAVTGALSLALVRNGEVLDVLSGTGAFDVAFPGPAQLYAFVYAVAAPELNVGSYYLNIQHQLQEPVPLPGAAWLMLSGVGLLASVARRRSNSSKSATA